MSPQHGATKEIHLNSSCQPSTIDLTRLRSDYPRLKTVHSATYCQRWKVALLLKDDESPVELELVSMHHAHQKTGIALIDPAFGVAGPSPKYVLRSLEAESWAVDGEKFLTGIIHEGSLTGLGVQVLRNIRRFGFHNLPGGRNETLARMLVAMPELEHLSLFQKVMRDSLEFLHLMDTLRNVCPALKSLSLHGSWSVVPEALYRAEVAKWLPELHLKVAMQYGLAMIASLRR